jgi:hypothetical protein
MDSPKNLNLVQMAEGYVAIRIETGPESSPGVPPPWASLPSNATHLKIYLSSAQGLLGNLYATIAVDSVDGLFFNAPVGWFGYATVRTYNITTGAESTNTNQYTLQMFERVCFLKHNIIHFFHETNTKTQWAISYRQGDNAVCILKSSDHFTNYVTIHAFPAGTIDNGGMLTFYIDKFGFMYVAHRPGALMSQDGGVTWQQLPWQFEIPAEGQITPFWNITEDESNDLIVFSEYGAAPNGPHHHTFWCNDPTRNTWTTKAFDWGDYRHIHGYHINPYMPNIHFLFLGDPINNQPSDGTPGFYVSQDHGLSWSGEVLSQFGDSVFRNGPCHVTWWKDGKAFISNDTAQTGYAEWWGNGTNDWGYLGLHPRINLQRDIESFGVWPSTPWGAMAVKGGYETYAMSRHDGNNYDPLAPSVLWRYDGNPNDAGDTGTCTNIAQTFWPAKPFMYMSGGRGNIFPDDADYVFSNAWGGIRIPRRPIRTKVVKGVIKIDQNTPNSFSSITRIPYTLPTEVVSASLVIYGSDNETVVTTYELTERGEAVLEVNGDELDSGTYYYALVADEEEIERLTMVKAGI